MATKNKQLKLKIAVITVSDRAHLGTYKDLSGPAAKTELKKGLAAHQLEISLVIVPDDIEQLKEQLTTFISKKYDFILTTGGTGISPRDITPDVTKEVIKKEVPGIAQAIREFSLKIKPSAMLSRGVAGLVEQTMIINLPGNPKAVKEIVSFLAPTLEHAYYMLKGIDIH